MKPDIKIAIACVVMLAIATVILNNGINWLEFVELFVLLILLFWLADIKIPIEIPNLLKIGEELKEIRRNLFVVAQNISNVKINNRITNVTPTSYEGPPIDIDSATGTFYTGTTILDPNEEIEISQD